MKILNIMCLLKSRIYTSRSVTHACDREVFITGVELFRWGGEKWHLVSKSHMVAMVFRKLKRSLCMYRGTKCQIYFQFEFLPLKILTRVKISLCTGGRQNDQMMVPMVLAAGTPSHQAPWITSSPLQVPRVFDLWWQGQICDQQLPRKSVACRHPVEEIFDSIHWYQTKYA